MLKVEPTVIGTLQGLVGAFVLAFVVCIVTILLLPIYAVAIALGVFWAVWENRWADQEAAESHRHSNCWLCYDSGLDAVCRFYVRCRIDVIGLE